MTSAEELLSRASVILLDFDGPICALMPPPVNAEAAAQAIAAYEAHFGAIPSELEGTTDHLAVLRRAGASGDRVGLRAVEAACDAAELKAADTASLSPGVREWVKDCCATGKEFVVVSNNSAACVSTVLHREGLSESLPSVLGRPANRPHLMKPDPYLVDRALTLARVDASAALMVGDSVTDVEAAASRAIPCLGYAKTPQRGWELMAAGAASTIASGAWPHPTMKRGAQRSRVALHAGKVTRQ